MRSSVAARPPRGATTTGPNPLVPMYPAWASCEHAFVSSERSPYIRFRRSLETQRLADVLPVAAELPWLNLSDSLEILTLMAKEGDARFDKAAVRWIGRLLVETPPLTLKEARWVVAMVEQLPRCRESLDRFARGR